MNEEADWALFRRSAVRGVDDRMRFTDGSPHWTISATGSFVRQREIVAPTPFKREADVTFKLSREMVLDAPLPAHPK